MPHPINDFPAVAVDPDRPWDIFRDLYLCQEPALMASIHRGDRREATRIINLVLVHIYSAVKERSGRSFTEWVRAARIDRACDLLRLTDLPLAAVADECGFCDQSYFTHVFQQLRNTTPGLYRAP